MTNQWQQVTDFTPIFRNFLQHTESRSVSRLSSVQRGFAHENQYKHLHLEDKEGAADSTGWRELHCAGKHQVIVHWQETREMQENHWKMHRWTFSWGNEDVPSEEKPAIHNGQQVLQMAKNSDCYKQKKSDAESCPWTSCKQRALKLPAMWRTDTGTTRGLLFLMRALKNQSLHNMTEN